MFAALTLFVTGEAHAQSLVITDCQGFTRATRSAQPGTTNRVEVQVNNPAGSAADGTKVTLTNTANGTTLETVATNGVAVFEQVPPGVFSVSTAQQGLTLGTIGISGAGVTTFTAVTTGVVATGAGAGAGSVAVSSVADEVQGDSAGSDGNDDDQEKPMPTPQPTPEPPVEMPTPRPTEPPQQCPGCDPDAEPPALDPFEPPAAQTQQLSPYS